jgi:hypothetical protein
MNKNTVQPKSGCKPQKANDKHDTNEMKHAADHKMKGKGVGKRRNSRRDGFSVKG